MINGETSLLNAPDAGQRLENLRALLAAETEKPEVLPQFSNNHIHTIYSFSPYSPTAAVWAARRAGLNTAGIMDHDTLSGAEEFRQAGRVLGLGTTCGFEMRVSLKGTPFAEKRMNNPDQTGVAYMAFHSVKSENFAKAQARLAPLREKRNERNRKMLANINRVTGFNLSFERDVLPLSQYVSGGTVTERHLLFALAGKLLPGGDYLERCDLLGQLKAKLIKEVYVPAEDELMGLDEGIAFAREIDCLLAYPYLGDVTVSVTGDKAPAKLEDDYLEELIAFMKERGVNFVTYMPSRNTPEQLDRLMALCEKYEMGQISGEDINSPRQSFICEQLARPEFAHLVSSAWEMVKREDTQ